MQKVIAKINLKNIEDNARAFKNFSGAKLCAVVKADAYGHGAEQTVNALEGVADMFAVALIDEGISLRAAACGKKILVLTPPVTDAEMRAIARNSFVATLSDFSAAKRACRVSKELDEPIEAHLKANTGMNRYGMDVAELERTCAFLKRAAEEGEGKVLVTGLYSHLYEHRFAEAEKQREKFLCMKAVCEKYFSNAVYHLSATYGATLGKEFAFDMVRVGLGLYGYLPHDAEDISPRATEALKLKKAMAVYAELTAERQYVYGGAGYGKPAFSLDKGQCLDVLRVGYADGFAHSGKSLLWRERNVNSLCMDACIRKSGSAGRGEAAKENRAEPGEYVPIMTDADEAAEGADTIAYEVLCLATKRAEMQYVYE